MSMRKTSQLLFGTTALSREYCPRCGDHAIFHKGKCVRRGCGYVLKHARVHGGPNTPREWNLETWRRKHRDRMRERREAHRQIISVRKKHG